MPRDRTETALGAVEHGPVEVIVDAVPVVAPPRVPQRSLADLLAEVILRGRSPQTQRAYRSDLQDFLVWLDQKVTLPSEPETLRHSAILQQQVQAALHRIQQVTEADINAYIHHLADGGLKPSTISRRLTPLRLLYDRLLRHHLIALNPMEDITKPKVSQHSTTVYLSRQEARRLEDHCGGDSLLDLRDHALIVTMLSTGLRSAEVLKVTFADLDVIDGHHVLWVTGKGNQRARVKLTPRAWQILKRYLDALRSADVESGAVFRRLRATRRNPEDPQQLRGYNIHGPLTYDGLKYILQARFTAAGLHLKSASEDTSTDGTVLKKATTADKARRTKATPHSLRHSFVTLALRGNAPLAKVQAAARHADPKTTIRYAHEQDELDDNAVDYVKW